MGSGIGAGLSSGRNYPDRADRHDQAHRRDPHSRWRRAGIPDRLGQRGPVRAQRLCRPGQGVPLRRNVDLFDAQYPHPARGKGARYAGLGGLSGRGGAALCRAHRRADLQPLLAALRPRRSRPLAHRAARQLPLPPRSDPAADEPGRRPRSRLPRRSPCPRRWRRTGSTAAITAPTATTRRRSTSSIWAGTMPIRPTSTRIRRPSAPSGCRGDGRGEESDRQSRGRRWRRATIAGRQTC